MKYLSVTLFFFIIVLGFDTPHPFAETQLSCTLSSSQNIYKQGTLPIVKVSIKNTGTKDIYLIGALDGSEFKLRYPYVYFTIEKDGAEKIKYLICRTTNPLRWNDFEKIGAGESFDPYMPVDESVFLNSHIIGDSQQFRQLGLYKIQFHYSTRSEKIEDYFGSQKRTRIVFGWNQYSKWFLKRRSLVM